MQVKPKHTDILNLSIVIIKQTKALQYEESLFIFCVPNGGNTINVWAKCRLDIPTGK